jgi:Raf kinase inhibitor-like YbhB/YbcL family protein
MKGASMKMLARTIGAAALVLVPVIALAQAAPPAGGRAGRGGPPAPRLSVTSSAWPDGGEIPARYSARGDNKSPAFEFHWMTGTTPSEPPSTLQSYAVIFHDVENSTARGTADTLHWSAFNIPGTAKGLPEGLGPGDLPDGTINGPGLARRNGNPGAYFGPGAGPGPFHHYVFEFYALDTKLDLPGTASREDLLKSMEGHVIGKAAFFGRYHGPAQ